MTTPSVEEVRAAVGRIYDPCSRAGANPTTIVDLGLVRDVAVSDDGEVKVVLGVTTPGCLYIPQLGDAVLEVVGALPGVRHVEVDVDTSFMWSPAELSDEARARRERVLLGDGAIGVRPREWQQASRPSRSGS
jgi:metal-sulfur cluster biosynthetic enzyme